MSFRLALVLALSIAGTSAALACRDAKNGRVVAVDNPVFPSTEAGRYAYRPDGSGRFYRLTLGSSARPEQLHFCVDLELPTPSGTDAAVGLYFWRNPDNIYVFEAQEGKFEVNHVVFENDHPLVLWTAIPAVGTDAARMREIEFEANDTGGTVKVDGRLVTDFIARPPSGDLEYGLLFMAKDKSTVLRFATPIIFEK